MSSSFLPPCYFNIFPFLLFLGDTHCLFILLVQHLDCTLAHCRRTKRKRNIEIASPYPVHPKSQHAPGPQLGKPGRGFVGRKIFSRLHLLPNPPVFCHHFPCPLQAVSWPCPCPCQCLARQTSLFGPAHFPSTIISATNAALQGTPQFSSLHHKVKAFFRCCSFSWQLVPGCQMVSLFLGRWPHQYHQGASGGAHQATGGLLS